MLHPTLAFQLFIMWAFLVNILQDKCLEEGRSQERKLTLGASPIEISCPDPE